LTESHNTFELFDEVKLVVKETNPIIVFDLCSGSPTERVSLTNTSQGLSLLVY